MTQMKRVLNTNKYLNTNECLNRYEQSFCIKISITRKKKLNLHTKEQIVCKFRDIVGNLLGTPEDSGWLSAGGGWKDSYYA